MIIEKRQRGRPVLPEGERRVAFTIRLKPETVSMLKNMERGAGRFIEELIEEHARTQIKQNINGANIMKNIILTIIMGFIVAASTACGKINTDADDAANTIASATGSLEDKLDELLGGIEEIASSDDDGDEYGEVEAGVEDETGAVYVATYYQVADTCGDYDFTEYLKLYSVVTEEGELSGETFFTDITGGDRMSVEIDADSEILSFIKTGSSALDRLACACDLDNAGFTCHCENNDDDSCAVVYDIK